jgi:hypothetical protein
MLVVETGNTAKSVIAAGPSVFTELFNQEVLDIDVQLSKPLESPKLLLLLEVRSWLMASAFPSGITLEYYLLPSFCSLLQCRPTTSSSGSMNVGTCSSVRPPVASALTSAPVARGFSTTARCPPSAAASSAV